MKADTADTMETETGKIKVSDIVFDPKIYPREKWNSTTVNIYADSLQGGAKFPPLILQKGTNLLLDGVHRWKSIEKYREKYEERKAQADTDNDRLEDWALPQDEVEVEYPRCARWHPHKALCCQSEYQTWRENYSGRQESSCQRNLRRKSGFQPRNPYHVHRCIEKHGGQLRS